ncbi:type II toxin-antitoxin system VapC family toxin [Minwuia sp.]|uniref:type II toxin-antitoxin system VapC family toxin n=1 Tax=Minwuia sp. TaxID=2493630 RepID=UPI003A8F0A4F
MTGLVIDTSVVGPWILSDEENDLSIRVLGMLEDLEATVPAIWFYEVGNLIRSSFRRGRLTDEETPQAVAMLTNLPIVEGKNGSLNEIIRICRTCDLSFYDAAYVDLALREKLPLATLDRRLADAASGAGVALFA